MKKAPGIGGPFGISNGSGCERVSASFAKLVFHDLGLFIQHPTEFFGQQSEGFLQLSPVAIRQWLFPLLFKPHQAFGDLANLSGVAASEAILIVGVTPFPVLGELLVEAGEVADNLVSFFFGQNLSDLVFEIVSPEA